MTDIQEAIEALRAAGYQIIPPAMPRKPPGWLSHYRANVAWIARGIGWNGGSDPELLLGEEQKAVARRRAMADHEFDLTKAIYGGTWTHDKRKQ